MSCRWCAHWSKQEDYNWDREDNEGMCTFNPVWVKTTDRHYCSRFMQEARKAGGSSMVFENNRSMHMALADARFEKDRRIAAEKVAKDLRAKIRRAKTEVSD